MRLKLLGCFLVAVFTLGISACDLALGGSKSKPSGPQPTTLSVGIKPNNTQCTKVAPCGFSIGSASALQLEATATFSDGASQNYTSQATWTASPSGYVTLSQSSGIETATGVKASGSTLVTITATSTNSLTATAVVTVNPAALSLVTVTPIGNGMAVGGTANYKATAVFSDGTTQDVTTTSGWTSSTDGVAGVGASSGKVSAAASGQTVISATYEGVTGSTALNVVSASGAYSNATLNGTYTFTLTATGTRNGQSVPEYFVGTLTFDGKGNITSGTMDTTGDGGTTTKVTGSVSIFADGRGTLTLNGTGLPSSTYRLVLTSNLTGTATAGQFIQFDGKGSAIGTLIQQAASWAIGANEVFRFTGVDIAAEPLGEVGAFAISGTNIASGEFDENDFGAIQAQVLVTGGSYHAPSSGRGTLQLQTTSATSNYALYPTQSGNMILISTDSVTTAPALLGYAEQQTGPFSAGTLNTGYAYLLERPPATGRGAFDLIGRIAFNGSNGVTGGAQDEVSGAGDDQINGTGSSYSTPDSDGRVALTAATTLSGTLNYVYYLVNNNRAFAIETDDSYGAVGTVDVEATTQLSNTDLNGDYGFAAADLSENPSTAMIGWFSANSTTGDLVGIGDVAKGTSLSSLIISSSYSVPAIGRTLIIPPQQVGAESYIFYVVSPCESYMLGVVPSFDATILNQSSTVCQ